MDDDGINSYSIVVAEVARTESAARGHIDGILRMVEEDAWCPDIVKQLSA